MSDQWEDDSDGFYGIDLSEITEFQQVRAWLTGVVAATPRRWTAGNLHFRMGMVHRVRGFSSSVNHSVAT